MSLGLGCSGLEGVVPSKDLTGAFFFLFSLIPIPRGHRRDGAYGLTPMREPIVSSGLCYSRMDVGVSGPDKLWGQPGPCYLQ